MQNEGAQLIACIPRLRRYARALLGAKPEAEDLVQDTVERGWSRLSSWRSGNDMRAWLFSIMHNIHIDQVRNPSIQTVELADDLSTPGPDSTQAGGLEIRDMEFALGLLPVEQREILLLVVLEEMTYQEVASTLHIPVGTVMSRLSRARERMRVLLKGCPTTSPLKVVK